MHETTDATRGVLCDWCRHELEATGKRKDRIHCSKVCRQAAYRARKVSRMEGADGAPRRIGYADPPYPGMSWKYYGDHPDYRGEVDHRKLIKRLQAFDGWVLHTSEKTLREVLRLCPPEARVASWVKPIGASKNSRGTHNTWEPIIYLPARYAKPGRRDWLSCPPARGGGETLPGRKPPKVVLWLFDLVQARPHDELVDMYPGTGVVTRCWRQACRRHLDGATAGRIV